MTNFERITQSSEAFANELLMRKSPCCYCVYKPDEGLKLKLTLKDIFEKTPCANEDCAEGITKWLNEPESEVSEQ